MLSHTRPDAKEESSLGAFLRTFAVAKATNQQQAATFLPAARYVAMQTLRSRTRTIVAGLALVVGLLPAVPLAATPAAAQSFFDFFFGGPRRQAPPPSARSYSDPNADNPVSSRRERLARDDSGPAVAYCVRLCDGRFFPIQRSGDATPAQVCSAFCPASRTKIFSGSAIDHARARDGARYSDLAAAYVYRERVVDGCTCNGKDAFGLVNMKAAEDPTLQPGDVVATNDGFVTYNGGRKRAEFTPIERTGSSLSSELRRRLSQTGIRRAPEPPQQTAEQSTGGTVGGGTVGRNVQRER